MTYHGYDYHLVDGREEIGDIDLDDAQTFVRQCSSAGGADGRHLLDDVQLQEVGADGATFGLREGKMACRPARVARMGT